MMRVTRIEAGGDADVLRVEGRVTHETSEELRMVCDAVLEEQRLLQLDVSGVKFVDDAGVAVLQALRQQGVQLEGCSGFVREMLSDAPAARALDDAAPSPRDRDAALLARLRAGDPEAFEVLVREYGGRMLATARRMVRNDDEAADVVQDAFLSAFRAIDGFSGTSMLSTWLHRIVVNAALMRLRTRRRRPEDSIEDLLPRFAEDGHWAEPVSRWDASADTLLERSETRTIVREAIDALPTPYRTVLVLRDVEDLDTDEVAALLRVTPNAVRTRLHRARQALRTLLSQRFAADDAPSPSAGRPDGPSAR